jgi:hypothetical protein
MKTNKIKNLILIIFLFANITVSFSQGEPAPGPWTAPPPSFEDDTRDNAPPLPIDEKTGLLVFSGILLAGFLIVKKQKKINQQK